MYHIYHTEALVLGGNPHGEGDRILALLTREIGLVTVHARSIRAGKSKLRYALQTFAHADVDLVRAKQGWKLASAGPRASHANVCRDIRKRSIVAAHARLLCRLLAGEDAHVSFYDDALAGIRFLGALPSDPALLRDTELLLVVRTLDALGYWGDRGRWGHVLAPSPFSEELLSTVRIARRELVALVNMALRETQL